MSKKPISDERLYLFIMDKTTKCERQDKWVIHTDTLEAVAGMTNISGSQFDRAYEFLNGYPAYLNTINECLTTTKGL